MKQDLVLKLHLELVGGFYYGASQDLHLNDEERKHLFAYAKAKKGISRDMIVPGDMTLHSLHYAIQELFGWQNSHLHNFALPEDIFNQLTDNKKFGMYKDLSGVLFRFPCGGSIDPYWDDDYDGKSNVKAWIRKKYCAPYFNGAICDTYLGNVWEAEDFMDRFPDFTYENTLDDINEKVAVEEDFNQLREHLTVGELLLPASELPESDQVKQSMQIWREKILMKVDELNQKMDSLEVDLESLRSDADELREWRESDEYLRHVKWEKPKSYQKEIWESMGMSYEAAVHAHKRQLSNYTKRCKSVLYDWNVELEACFPELYYLYDYGDDWCVKITAEERQHSSLAYEALNGQPVCVQADGLNLVDDCGGISGYLNMLQVLNGEDEKDAEEMKTWASSLGWTGKLNKPGKML